MLCATGILPSSFYVISFVILWAMMCVASRVHPWNCFLQYRSQCCPLFWKYQRCVHPCNPCDQHWALHKALCYPQDRAPTLEITSRSILLNIASHVAHSIIFLSMKLVRTAWRCLFTYAASYVYPCATPQQFMPSWFSSSFSSPLLNQKRSLWRSECRLRSAVCVMKKIQ